MDVERYSHVMHIVSRVYGRIAPGRDAAALLRATFPAGTVSGAPKVRAMQIISELESRRRGAYAGAIGYLGFGGDMDTCIALRTIVLRDSVAYLQSGGGVVADSDPEDEYQEAMNKLAALGAAIDRRRDGGVRAVSRVLVIDNYDSFTYNLVDYIATAGAEVHVARNDRIDLDEAEAYGPTPRGHLAGTGHAREAGVSGAVIERFAGRIPILGVCLGHQVIVRAVRRHGRSRAPRSCTASPTGQPRRLAALRRPPEPVRGRPLPLAGGHRADPRRAGGDRAHADGEVMGVRHRDHSDARRAVPPGVGADARTGRAADRELPGHAGGGAHDHERDPPAGRRPGPARPRRRTRR